MARQTDYSTVFSKSMQPQNYEILESMKQQSTTTTIANNNPNPIPTGNFSQEQITLLSNLPFWINDPTEHANIYDSDPDRCCFNHYVGLPEKDGEHLPLFDYQVHEQYKGQPGLIYAFEKYDAVYVLKATGIGFSDLSLRWMCYKAHTGSPRQYRNSEMVIVTGPRHELATKQINRIRSMYYDRLGILFTTDQTKVILPPNNVTIQSYPSHNVDSFRGLPKVSIVLIDEGDFFPPGQQQAVRDAAERYLGKSKAKIILGSTPYNPGGLMEKIQREETSLYKRLYLNYEVGLNKIFKPEDIARAKTSPSFEREYNLRYAYDIGDLLTHADIQKCLDIQYDPSAIIYEAPKSIGIDPAFGGSSKFAFVATQYVDGRIQVIAADEFERPEPREMETYALDLIRQLHLFEGQSQNGQVLVDGANVSFIKLLKHKLNENTNYEDDDEKDHRYKRVRPMNFGTKHRHMLTNMQQLISKGYLAIDERYEDLINQLRIAKVDNNYGLIKKPLSLDLIDSLRLALWGYEIL